MIKRIQDGSKMHEFEVKVTWKEQKKGKLFISSEKPSFEVATPPIFKGGHEGIISPQDLFVASAISCYMTTFTSMTSKTRGEYLGFACKGIGILEVDEDGGSSFSTIKLFPRILAATEDDISKLRRAVELTEKYCLVTRSLKSSMEISPEIVHEIT